MAKYDEYDARLLQVIANGADTLSALTANSHLKRLAEPHRVKNPCGGFTEYYRVVDRRLQALRRSGKIAHVGGRWHVLGAA